MTDGAVSVLLSLRDIELLLDVLAEAADCEWTAAHRASRRGFFEKAVREAVVNHSEERASALWWLRCRIDDVVGGPFPRGARTLWDVLGDET